MAENSHSMAAPGPTVWEKVPKRNPNFTGRAELLTALRKSINTVTAVVAQPRALQGLGGVGKTQLAIEYAWQYRAHYDFVWWISADQPVLVPSSLAAMGPALGLPLGTGVEQATQAVLRTLQSGTPYRSWLIIFDNAEDPEYIRDFIPRGPGHVLITSRNSRWSDHEPTIQVDVFERQESVDFLGKRLKGMVTETQADLLADKLGDLPLALEQAAALLARTLMPVEEYVTLLDEQTSRLLSLEKSPTYPQSMTAAWQLSVAQLEDRVPEAVELLRCCAFFGPEPIPRDVFRRGNRVVGPRLEPILSDPILLSSALSNLERYALVKIEPNTRTLQVHRLNQALLRDETPAEERRELRHEVHLLLSGSAPDNPDDTSNWRSFEELAAHLRPSGLMDCEVPSVRKFALDLVRYMYVRGSFQQARALLSEYIERWTQKSGAAHSDVLLARAHLGNVYRALALYREAYDLDSETLRLLRESLGHDHPHTIWATSSYAATLRARGDFAQAREVDQEAVEAYERLYGGDNIQTLRARNNLAVCYALTGDYDQAKEILGDAFRRASAGEQMGSRFFQQVWSNLSRVTRLSGQLQAAADLGEDLHSYGITHLGEDHPNTLLAAKDYAIALRRIGQVGEAVELMRTTYKRFRRLYGDAHSDTMAAALGLSNALRAHGDLVEAERMSQHALRYYPEVFGEDHPFTAACEINIALLKRLGGELITARELDEKALASLARRVGRDHDYSLSCAVNLQNDLAALGESEQARKLGEETLRRLRERVAPDHFLSLMCAANLSQDLAATGAETEAARLHAETMELMVDVLGREHPDTLAAMSGERLNSDFDPPPI